MTEAHIPKTLWTPVLHFVDQWIAYRDMGINTPLFSVSWEQVMDAEVQARVALVHHGHVASTEHPIATMRTPDVPHLPDLSGELKLANDLVTQLRAENRTLRAELRELEHEPKDSKTQAVVDITRTLGYMYAAANAPRDAVQAYRAGMVYAAQMLLPKPRPPSPRR